MKQIGKRKNKVEDRVSYLETSSYYKDLQDAVSKIVKLISPRYMVELGCGNGNTTVRLASENPLMSIVALEMARERVDISTISAKKKKIRNIAFVQGDFTKLSNLNLKNTELVIMVYSFAWISDPLENKLNFLKGIYDHLTKGAYFLIADTFLLSNNGTNVKQLEQLFKIRKKEVREVAFWNNFRGLDGMSLARAEEASVDVEKSEEEAFDDAVHRTKRCFVDMKWLVTEAQKIGFEVVLSRDVNALNDGVVLLKK